jgi:hypothetical protein
MARVGADRGPDIVRQALLKVGLKAFAVGVVDMPVYYTHIGRNLDLVAPKHDTTVGATVTVVAEENVAVEVQATVFGVGAIVTVAVAKPVVGGWVAVAVVK